MKETVEQTCFMFIASFNTQVFAGAQSYQYFARILVFDWNPEKRRYPNLSSVWFFAALKTREILNKARFQLRWFHQDFTVR